MADHDAFRDLEKAKEDEYFHRKERELIEKLRRRAAMEEERRRLAIAIGNADQETLQDLQELGYTADTVRLLYIVPLINVAWAEGYMSQSDRNLILEAARLRGIEPDSQAALQLLEWLNHKPSEEFFQKTLRIVAHLLHSLPEAEQEAAKRDLYSYCLRVAQASDGILGYGHDLTDAEKDVLKRIATELERKE